MSHPRFIAALITGIYLTFGSSAKADEKRPLPYVSADGKISMPTDYREKFMHLGTWSLGDQMHEVYTQAESIAEYKRTGKFPDGTVLVKEVRHSESGEKTTGEVRWATDKLILWFVMIKDDQKRFESDFWKEGWGWALFKAGAPTKQVATSYESDCMRCHIPAARTDHVFVEGYPLLHTRPAMPLKK